MKAEVKKFQTSTSDRTVRRGSWLRRFFWGVDKATPCFMGRQNTYVDHWLVGAHSWDPGPC